MTLESSIRDLNFKERATLKDKKRIVIKIGSSSLMHESTGKMNLLKIEKLVRLIVDLKNSGKEIVLVSSGAIAVGRNTIGLETRPNERDLKQACAAIGQAKLMMVYQKIFSEYNTIAAQVLLTKNNVTNDVSRDNAMNTLKQIISIGAIPVVNENDSVSTYEIEQLQTFGDNDRLSAIVASLIDADLLILLTDIDGLYTDDPKKNKDASFVPYVNEISEEYASMGKDTAQSGFGTGGMSSKIDAARMAGMIGADTCITNGDDVTNIIRIINGENVGTLFKSHKKPSVDMCKFVEL